MADKEEQKPEAVILEIKPKKKASARLQKARDALSEKKRLGLVV